MLQLPMGPIVIETDCIKHAGQITHYTLLGAAGGSLVTHAKVTPTVGAWAHRCAQTSTVNDAFGRLDLCSQVSPQASLGRLYFIMSC